METGTEIVERIFNDVDAVLCIGRLTLVETPSAFAKKVRIGELRLKGFTATCQRLIWRCDPATAAGLSPYRIPLSDR